VLCGIQQYNNDIRGETCPHQPIGDPPPDEDGDDDDGDNECTRGISTD
jgi:hypothetical protein